MREGYKMTELGEIPEEWEVVCLGEIGDFKNGINKSKEDFGHGVPFVNLMNVFGGNIVSGENLSLVNATAKEIKDYELQTGDVLFIRSSVKPSGVGLTAIIPFDFTSTVYSGFLIRFRDGGQLETQFKRYCFYEEGFRNRLINQSSVSANTNINQGALEKLHIALPPLQEQQKIATILSTVDEKIEVIDAQITQTRELKKGLTQKLLTRGIGHTKFKDSVLGEIPESWEVDLLENVSKRVSGHTPSKSFDSYYNGGIKWVSLADSFSLDKGLIFETKFEISEEGVKNSSAVVHPKGTVLMSRDAGVGKSAVMGNEMAVSQHFIAWICEDKLNNWYLYYLLQFRKEYFERIAVGSTIKTIGLPIFKKLQILVPPVSEQNQIATILNAIDEKLDTLQTKKETYQQLKKGLMQQLLTGKVRVMQSELQNA